MIDTLLNLQQVAEILGVSDYTVRTKLVRDQGLPHLRVGTRLRFRREQIEGWIEEQERKSLARQKALAPDKILPIFKDRGGTR